MSTFRLPPLPDFNVNVPAMPNPVDQMAKVASLKNMLSEQTLRAQLAPLQVQEQQQRVQAATLQNQTTQTQQNDLVAFGKMFLASQGDTNALTQMIADPKRNFGLSPQGIGPALQQVIAHREAMYKMDDAQAAHTDMKNNIILPLLKQLDDAKQADRPAIRGQVTETMKNAGVFSPEEIAAMATLDLDQHSVAWNLAAHRSQKQLLDERKAASEEQTSQGALLRGQAAVGELNLNQQKFATSPEELARRAAAGDPDAKAILAQQATQSGAVSGAQAAAKFPWEARLEQMKQQGDPVFAYDPKSKQTVQVSRSEAQQNGFSNIVKVGQSEIDKAKTAAMQLGDATMNIQAYKQSSQKMGELSATDKSRIASLMSDPQLKVGLWGTQLPTNWLSTLSDSGYLGKLSPEAQDVAVSYIAARPAAISLLRAINPGVRLTEAQIATELRNIPDPTTPSGVRDKQFQRLDRNIDQASKTLVRIPGVDLPSDIRDRLQSQETQTQAAKQQGQYRASNPVTVGQNIQIRNVPGLSRVKKTYPDGSFDADQK
jgi:hypothetical protein